MASTLPNGHHDREHDRLSRASARHEERIAKLEAGHERMLELVTGIREDVRYMRSFPFKLIGALAGIAALVGIAVQLVVTAT